MYIREAHPIDGERPSSRLLVEQPRTDEERNEVANMCIVNLDLGDLPTLLDGVDDKTSRAYVAHPDRLYLVGRDGRIAFAGAKGPRGFKPEELEEAILVELGQRDKVVEVQGER